MKSIYEFKKGDIITRVEPSAPLGKGGFFGDEGFRDRSYIGEKYILAGIANGCIYLKRIDALEIRIFGNKLIDLPLDIFENGWNYWIDPQTLLEDIDETLYVSTNNLQEAINKAIEEENYEAANKLKKLLDKKK